MKIDKIYVTTIKTKNEVLKKNILQLGVEPPYKWEIMWGTVGVNTDREWKAYENWKIENHINDWWNRDVLEGEVGCGLSHLAMWEKAYKENYNCVLFLEEDFKLLKSLKDLDLETLPKDADGFYLGRNKIGNDKKVGNGWVKPGYSYNTHAYCLTRSGIKKILKYNYINNLIASDEFLAATYTKHPRKDVADLFPPTLTFYAHEEEWIGQTSNPTTSSTENTQSIKKYEILDDSDWKAWGGKYLNPIIRKGEYDLIVDHLGDEVYEFPLFTKRFCDEIIAMTEELDNWTYERHKFYPTTDVLLEDIGMNRIYNRILNEIIRPLAVHIWTLEGKSWHKVNSENFLARYLPDAQSHLSLHHDHSHLSLVVKLNDEFDGGGTYFPKYGLLSNPERIGTATLHPGQITHRHGARPIYSGKRYIIVSFITNNGDI